VGDTSGRTIYAMRVSEKLTMAEYDQRCRAKLRVKLPDPHSEEPQEWAGDAVWDFLVSPPRPRRSTHDEGNRKTDLGGEYALLSDQFFYFGKAAQMLPDHLLGLVKQGPGHRAQANAALLKPFLAWIERQKPGVHGEPQEWERGSQEKCGSRCARYDEEDEQLVD